MTGTDSEQDKTCDPSHVILGRCIEYRDGKPLVRRLNSARCNSAIPSFKALKQIGYFNSVPLAAYGWECCDALCTDQEEQNGDCYKLPDCFPYGAGPGITKRIAIYLGDLATCWTARKKNCPTHYLEFNESTERWEGSVSLRGGTLNLSLECTTNPLDINPDTGLPYPTFRLHFSGCQTGSVDAIVGCLDPLDMSFQVTLDKCCDCNNTDPTKPATNVLAEVNLWIVANCRRVRFARHIGYVDGKPLVAHYKPCLWNQSECYSCGNMSCPIVATVSGCTTCNGIYPLDYDTIGWTKSSLVPSIPSTASFDILTVSCNKATPAEILEALTGTGTEQPLPPLDKLSCEYIKLSVQVSYGADNTGFGHIVIPAYDLEDLDVIVPVEMITIGGGCTGVCRYVFDEMANAWLTSTNTCTGDCGECPDAASFPPGVDGEIKEIPCTGSSVSICCTGIIPIRLSR